ncbi:STAS domain-containing protein [Aidingimonas lacisalsi]|uniref:STAS domain-containing protein n=1 Tax=Aidingimonas lacisalsi TaxID=2604086 RepID=UPI0011D27098|nr:STAS domain-containing protein [Aidingimonas lacisalsi]
MRQLFEAQGASLMATDRCLTVSGDVDFDVAAALASAGSEWLAACASGAMVELDFAGVQRVSSAALSVMLEWMRHAIAADLHVQAVHLSPPLRRLTEVASLDALLPVA